MEQLQPGDPDRIGPYLLLGRLGAGGMGQVFLGRSPGGWLVAVKVIRADMAADPEFRARFFREVAAARKVSGMFTAAVVDADPEARLPWLATGFVNGPSLAQGVDVHGPLPAASVLALAAGLAEGLSAIHAVGVVHRDLKPSNVLLAADGPRVIDFGISRAADGTALTGTGMMIGSPGFMSPEQADGREVGPASDVFSLGAILIFAATGAGPFGEGPPSAQLYRVVHVTPSLAGLPGPLVPLVGRCLAKDPGRRPTAAQFLAEFRAIYPPTADLGGWLPAAIPPAPEAGWMPTLTAMAQPSPQSPPLGSPPPGPARTGRRRRLAAVAVAAILVVGAVVGVSIAAPWKKAPVLRPAGLVADSSTASSVAFRWSGPAKGPIPDRYRILRDGQQVGSVPGNITFYQGRGLAPASSYHFQVVAVRGGTTSRRSTALAVSTLTPPVSAAALTGEWTATEKIRSLVHSQSWAKVGHKWSDNWTFTPRCPSGPCAVTLTGSLNGDDFTASLARDGAAYSGTAHMSNFTYCQKQGDITVAVHISIKIREAATSLQFWEAQSWSGTIVMNQPRVDYRDSFCLANTFKLNVASQ